MNSYIATNLVYNELEYFCYLNHWLLFLFFFIVTFYSILKITTLYFNKIYYNDTFIEFVCTLFSLLFLLFIISPALIILLDIDSIIMPSFIIYTLGYQWAWTYSISYLHSNIGYTSYHDHYIMSSYFYRINILMNQDFHHRFINDEQLTLIFNDSWFNDLDFFHYNIADSLNPDTINDSLTWFINDLTIFHYNINDSLTWFINSCNIRYCVPQLLLIYYYMIFSHYYDDHSNLVINELMNHRFINYSINSAITRFNNIIINDNSNLAIIYSNSEDHATLINSLLNTYLFEINTYLVIPLWSCIKIYCFSLDVIHSLSFYSFGFKIDAIPGRINLTSSLRSLINGVNRGFCYELCGEQHNTMLNTWILT